jgi:hypothetical protein
MIFIGLHAFKICAVCRREDYDIGLRLNFNKKFWEELIAYFPWYDTGHIRNGASNNSSIVTCVFVTAVTFLPSRCLATTGGFLPRRSWGSAARFAYKLTFESFKVILTDRRRVFSIEEHFVNSIWYISLFSLILIFSSKKSGGGRPSSGNWHIHYCLLWICTLASVYILIVDLFNQSVNIKHWPMYRFSPSSNEVQIAWKWPPWTKHAPINK